MWKKSEHTVNQPRARHSHYASANRLRQQGSLISPFPVSPSGGKPGRAGSPRAAGTLCASKKRWHTSMPRLPPQEGFQSAPLKPPLRIPPMGTGAVSQWSASICGIGAGEKIKDGRHVGLDFYDLLIEAFTDPERVTGYSEIAYSDKAVLVPAQAAIGQKSVVCSIPVRCVLVSTPVQLMSARASLRCLLPCKPCWHKT